MQTIKDVYFEETKGWEEDRLKAHALLWRLKPLVETPKSSMEECKDSNGSQKSPIEECMDSNPVNQQTLNDINSKM